MGQLRLQLGDIVSMSVEAIVNSTDESLLAGGPVHAAIHRAAGPGLRDECVLIRRCPTGEARITDGHGLTARYVIHTVAPMWNSGGESERKALESCYQNALRLAEARGVRTLAFPSIGSGLQPQIPLDKAAPIAIQTIHSFLANHALPEQVTLVCFDPPTYMAYQKAIKEVLT